MSLTPKSFLFLFLSLLLLLLFPLSATSSSIQKLLQNHGLPGGLFPENVKSFDLDQNGHLEVHLDGPCMAKYETRVHFDSVVRANLSYGGLVGLQGLSQEELFLWFPVKGIIVSDPSSGLILFDIGLAHKQLSRSLFEDPPVCKPQAQKFVEQFVRRRSSRIGFLVLSDDANVEDNYCNYDHRESKNHFASRLIPESSSVIPPDGAGLGTGSSMNPNIHRLANTIPKRRTRAIKLDCAGNN